MKQPQSAHLLSMFALCSFFAVGATQVGAAPATPQVTIESTDVNDDRSTDNSSLTVKLKFQGKVFNSAQALRATITTAEDETGRSLITTKPHAFSAFAHDFQEIGKTDKADVSLRLVSPPRDVMKVKQITGELEIYTPSHDANSVVVLKNPDPQSESLLTSPVLKSAGVSVALWTAERYKSHQQEEVKKKGVGEALSQGMGTLLGQMFGGNTNSSNSVIFHVEDPALRLVKISIVDSAGKAIESKGKLRMGTAKKMDETWMFDKKLPANAKIKLYVTTPKSVVKVPFQTQNVALP